MSILKRHQKWHLLQILKLIINKLVCQVKICEDKNCTFHLYDFLEQAKLINSEKKSKQWLPLGGVGAWIDWERVQGNFLGDNNVLNLNRVWD